jgi:hypothetical protein
MSPLHTRSDEVANFIRVTIDVDCRAAVMATLAPSALGDKEGQACRDT